MVSVLDAVREAYRAGLCVLPVREDGTKAPDVSSWRAFQTTRPTLEAMREWDFATRTGFGVVAGPVSGHVESWDFDCPETFDAFVEAAASCGLGDVVRRIRAGFENMTPGGGRRWLVRYPASVTWAHCTLARRPGCDGEPAAKVLVELPTFSILAPSHGGVHPSGRPYARTTGSFGSIASYDVAERDGLLELARSFDTMPRRNYDAVRQPKTTAAPGDMKPGADYTARTTWPELLEPDGWTYLHSRGDTAYWRRPGKTAGVSATTNHGGGDCLYVFSSSTTLDPECSYSRFGYYTATQHAGDFSAAGKALARKGYGSRPTAEAVRVARRPTPETPATPAGTASWRWLADVPYERPDWLWPCRLARGALTLLIGDGGLGKSRVTHDLAARLSTGDAWPDQGNAPHGCVVVLSAEDSPSYTVRPSVEAAGGDVKRVAVLEAVADGDGAARVFRLDRDLPALESLVEQTEAVLVVVDPLSAYFGTALDSYRDSDVRSVLAQLVALADRRRIAVLGVMHIGKASDRHARHRVLGSVAFVNAARLVFAVGADADDPARRLVAPVKANICREAPTLAFRLVDVDGTARVDWEAAPVANVDADTVLNARPLGQDDERQDADGLLRQLLADEAWPMPASAVQDAGRAHGVSARSLQRAARRRGVRITKGTFIGGWLWHRPAAETPEAETPEREDDTAAREAETPGHEDDTSPKATRRRQCIDVSSSAHVSSSQPEPRHEDDMSSSGVFVKVQQNTQRREDDTSESTRAREAEDLKAPRIEAQPPEDDTPAWALTPETAPEPGTSDAVLAARDAEDDGVELL